MPPIREYGDEYAEYGDAPKAPTRFAPYGEYAEAFRLTAAVRVEGRSGIVGAVVERVEVEEIVEEDGVAVAVVDMPVEAAIAGLALAVAARAPALSQGLGGDTAAIFSQVALVLPRSTGLLTLGVGLEGSVRL